MTGIFVYLKCDGSPVFLGLPADTLEAPADHRLKTPVPRKCHFSVSLCASFTDNAHIDREEKQSCLHFNYTIFISSANRERITHINSVQRNLVPVVPGKGMPMFIPSLLWPPNSPDLNPVDYSV